MIGHWCFIFVLRMASIDQIHFLPEADSVRLKWSFANMVMELELSVKETFAVALTL